MIWHLHFPEWEPSFFLSCHDRGSQAPLSAAPTLSKQSWLIFFKETEATVILFVMT